MDNSNKEKIDKYLDELAEEYKTLLYKTLQMRSPFGELSISELLRIDNEVKKHLLKDYSRKQRIKKLFLTVGLLYIMLGSIIYIFYQVIQSSSLDTFSLLSITVVVLGVSLSALYFVIDIFKLKVRKKDINTINKSLLEYDVVKKWRELEAIINDLAVNNNIEKPSYVLQYLYNNKYVNKNDYQTLRNFLKLRNKVVHSHAIDITKDEYKKVYSEADKVIKNLGNIFY